jgi:hypothetical protein
MGGQSCFIASGSKKYFPFSKEITQNVVKHAFCSKRINLPFVSCENKCNQYLNSPPL